MGARGTVGGGGGRRAAGGCRGTTCVCAIRAARDAAQASVAQAAAAARHARLPVIISRNSGNSMWPDASESMSEIIFLSSSFFTSKPSARIAALSSR